MLIEALVNAQTQNGFLRLSGVKVRSLSWAPFEVLKPYKLKFYKAFFIPSDHGITIIEKQG